MGPPAVSVPAAQLREEWSRDLPVLRQCRGLQKKIAEVGIHYPIVDLLVMRGHLGRDLARRVLPADHLFPSDAPTRHPEEAVVQRALETGKLKDAQCAAARAIVRSVAQLGVPITLLYVLVQLKYLKWKDLFDLDRRLDEKDRPLEDADTRERPAAGLPLEDADTRERPSVGLALEDAETRERSIADLGRVRLDEGTRRRAEMRMRLLGIPEADLLELVRETGLLPAADVEAAAAEGRGASPPVPLVEVLLQRETLTLAKGEVLVETYLRRRRKG